MAAGGVQLSRDPPGQAGLVYEDPRIRVTRVDLAGHPVIRKEPIGPDADPRLRHEFAMLQRLRGVTGVAQLAEDATAGPGAMVLTDAGAVCLAAVSTPLPVDRLVGLGLRLARAVSGMHRRGVMHRNICPANIVLGHDGDPCLVGFSSATAMAEIRPEFTHPSRIVGELAYLAPEQTGRTGRAVDERADLYALGATLYALATGLPPFGRGDPLRLIRDHLTRLPAPPRATNPAVPEALSQIILHLLEKEPDRRYQSADGLAHDLQQLPAIATAGLSAAPVARAEFRLGERDVPWRLVPPSRLVGRDGELAALESAVEEALAGECRGVLVAGAPGVGKTALVDQLRSVVTGRDGWFVAGKFDQYRRDLEFDAGYQSFRALGRLLLAEPEDELAEVRGRILRALGPNAGLLAAGASEFAALLAVPPDPGDPLTAQARVQWASVQVLRAVASRKRPVLVFLDDLQWAGRSPLGLVDLVLRGEPVDGLLLVGAYRDNEVDAVHPLAALLARWHGQAGVRQVRLADLPGSGVGAMVAEMLHLDQDDATGLAELIAPYTGGNPYETVELLNTLRQGGVLTATAGGWRWEASAVRGYLDAADPARLLAGRVAALPEPSRRMVEAMACLGGRAELDLLVTAAGAPAGVVEQGLELALVEGLLVAEPGAVRFRHDRIREAVLADVGPPQRRGLHLAIARRLAGVPELFAVAAEQYLPVVDAVTDATERRQVVALLRRAAEQAALIGEYTLVSRLLGAAVRLIDPGETDTLLAVRTVRHAALFSAGNLDGADEEYQALAELVPSTIERADATAVQMSSLTHRNRYAEALALGLESLRELGIAMPDAGRFGAYLDHQFTHLHRWLEDSDTDIVEQLARPAITDPALLATTRLISPSLSAAFFGNDVAAGAWLGLEAMRIWREHGPAPSLVGPACNANYAAMALRDDYATSYRTARRMLAQGEARGYEPGTSQARHLFTTVVFWFEPIEEAVRSGRRAREGLTAGGNLAWAAYTFHQTVCCLLECAPSLDDVAAEVRAGLAFTGRTGNEQTSEMLESYLWLVGALRGEGSAAETIPVDRLAGNQLALFHAHVSRAAAAAVFGDAAGLARHTEAAMPLLPAAFGQYTTVVARLLRGLALAEQARTDQGDLGGLLVDLDELIGWLATRAVDAPANFSHLVRLLEAERAWALGDFRAAELGFDTALREVSQHQRPWHLALTTERAARFYLAHGLDHVGHQLLAQARLAYAGWGATAKVDHLDWAYPTLRPASVSTTVSGGHDHAELVGQPPGGPAVTSATPVTSGTIDLLGILSASQALSSETTTDRLHTRVAEILGAMTGATHVRLLLRSAEHNHWFAPTAAGDNTPLTEGHEHTVPMSVLRYLHRTGEPLLVANATDDDRFARDPYFTDVAGGCALLAVPILSRGALRAVLLLENRLIRGAFSIDRLDAVRLIAGQLAVSLDNAQLYAELTASRKRIVATADHTRQRIERDLHDGAQQRLVSVALQLGVARAAVPSGLGELAAQLDRVAAEATAAFDQLREIAHGLHPSVLSTGGLGPALRALARRAPIPVHVQVRATERLPEPVEASAYYTVAEALTNAIKHAHATTVTITVDADTDTDVLHLTVRDDGGGGADVAQGTGLLGLKDRVEALGGRIHLDSPVGEGTTLQAQIPLAIAGFTHG